MVSMRQNPLETVSLGKSQQTLGQCRILQGLYGLHTLFSPLIFIILLLDFSVTLWVAMGQMWSFPEILFFSKIFSPGILLADTSLLSCLGWELSLQTLKSVQVNAAINRGNSPHFYKYALSSFKWMILRSWKCVTFVYHLLVF